jgi:hypothetical protein
MTMQFLRREAARACPIHGLVYECAVKYLVEFGVFSKQEVIDELNFGAISDSVRWDYIREFIQEDQKTELIPLAENFFTRHKKAEERVNPGRFIAQGHGKKTFGYAAVTPENDHLVVRRIEQRKAISNGVADAFHTYLRKVNDKRVDQGMVPVREQTVLLQGTEK